MDDLNKFNYHSVPTFSDRNLVDEYELNHSSTNLPIFSNVSHPVDVSPSSGVSFKGDTPAERDFFDGDLKYISQMLLEEDALDHQPGMLYDNLALQAAEKSFYDVLGKKYPPSPSQETPIIVHQNAENPDDDLTRICSTSHGSHSSTAQNNFVEPNWNIRNQGGFESSFGQPSGVPHYTLESNLQSFGSLSSCVDSVTPFQNLYSSGETQFLSQSRGNEGKVTRFFSGDNYLNRVLKLREDTFKLVAQAEKNDTDHSLNVSMGKKNHRREDVNYVQGRSNKQLASYAEEPEQSEIYDKLLLYPGLHDESELHGFDEATQDGANNKLQQNEQLKGSNHGRPHGKKRGKGRQVVDFRGLLIQCSKAVASNDSRTCNELLRRIRQHSSPYGDGNERLTHCFANALEARLVGTGTSLYAASAGRRIPPADILKAYQAYVTASPFKRMSYILANKSVAKLAEEATRLHIIDFGILFGFQWPCLIQGLSVRPGGPPKLHITGIDFPRPGFRPGERIEETGRRLANYCKRFNVPFEYNAIAKTWHTIQVEDLKIDRDEMLVVNCMYRLKNVPDETIEENSPRKAVLNLIKRINPDMFIHGVVNGTYNSPFFIPRFREALFHFSALFDMFEDTLPREDQGRALFEEVVLTRDAMNVVACEGSERVDRPETYKQWQVRNLDAGFRQLPLNQDIMKEIRAKVKLHYHKDFVVDEDSHWMLHGWKGRIIYALSCWKPTQE